MRWTLLTLALSTPGVGAAAASIGEARPPVVAEAPIVAGELDTPRFRILHTARAKGAARKLADEVESTRSYFDKVLGRDWPGTTEIRVGFGRQEFSALALPGDRPPDWSRAYSYPKENIIVLEASSLSEADGNTILRHELLHVALGQLGGDWPHWFHDGLAMFLTGRAIFGLYREPRGPEQSAYDVACRWRRRTVLHHSTGDEREAARLAARRQRDCLQSRADEYLDT